MAIEIVDLPIKHGDFPYVSLPEGNPNEGFQKWIPKMGWMQGGTPRKPQNLNPCFCQAQSLSLNSGRQVRLRAECW